MTLPAAGQPASCTDSLTKLPPPFDFQAPVSALPEGERGLLRVSAAESPAQLLRCSTRAEAYGLHLLLLLIPLQALPCRRCRR
jgi:hypothetical protein